MTRLLVLGDLHGRIPAIPKTQFDAIIAPGDIIGDDIREHLREWMRESQYEPIDFEAFCPVDKQEEIEDAAIEKGKKVLSHLNKKGVPVFLVPGNWDPVPLVDGIRSGLRPKSTRNTNRWKQMLKAYPNITDVMHTSVDYDGMTIIGHGATSEPELLSMDEETAHSATKETFQQYRHDTKVAKKLHKLFTKARRPVLFLSHNVPFETKLDIIDKPGSPLHQQHYGSILARELIETHAPLLCIGGHIHEGRGKDVIEDTPCLNGGFGSSTYALVTIDPSQAKVTSISFHGENETWE